MARTLSMRKRGTGGGSPSQVKRLSQVRNGKPRSSNRGSSSVDLWKARRNNSIEKTKKKKPKPERFSVDANERDVAEEDDDKERGRIPGEVDNSVTLVDDRGRDEDARGAEGLVPVIANSSSSTPNRRVDGNGTPDARRSPHRRQRDLGTQDAPIEIDDDDSEVEIVGPTCTLPRKRKGKGGPFPSSPSSTSKRASSTPLRPPTQGGCLGKTSKGKQCSHLPLVGSKYCNRHSKSPEQGSGQKGKISKTKSPTAVESANETPARVSINRNNSKTESYKRKRGSGGIVKQEKNIDEFEFISDQEADDVVCSPPSRKSIKQKNSRSGAAANSTAKDASAFEFPKDSFFFEGTNQMRCIVLSHRGKPCRYQKRFPSGTCYMHSTGSPPSTSPLSSNGKVSPVKDDVDDSFREEEAEAEDVAAVAAAPLRSPPDDSVSDITNPQEDYQPDEDVRKPYSYSEFNELWETVEDFCGEDTNEIENTRRVRGANAKMNVEDSDGQLKAQYGRLLPKAMKTLIDDIMCLKRDDIFLDIGHGIGSSVLQVAFTVGCEARGLEVVFDRNAVAEVYRDTLLQSIAENPKPRIVGKIDFRHGRLEDPEQQDFLVKGVNRAYVNNFNGVFAERSMKVNQKWFLDDYVAAIFAKMAPHSILVTLHPISLGPARSAANEHRINHGLEPSDNASFYEMEKVFLGRACDTVKWNQFSSNQKKIYVYKYTKLDQPNQPAGKTVFLCGNPECKFAREGIAIVATTLNEEGRGVMNHCTCKISAKNLRRQPRKTYMDC